MNSSTPISLQKKIKYLQENIQKIYAKITSKQGLQQNQMLKIKLITFLDQNIDRIQLLVNNQIQTYNSLYKDTRKSLNGYASSGQNQKYYELARQKIQLQKKLMQYRQKQLKKQQYTIDLEKNEIEQIKIHQELQSTNRQLMKKLQYQISKINKLSKEINSKQQQIQRLISLNHRQNEEIQNIKIQRNRISKEIYQLKQKFLDSQDNITGVGIRQGPSGSSANKAQRFNYKNTEGLKQVRIFTNMSNQKKNHEKYVLVQLPSKIQVQKLVYGIRLGVILQNKQIFYFNDLFLYERDPMILKLQGNNLSIQYIKRKENIIIDKCKITKPQIIVLLYGKGDSLMIDETKG